MEAPALRRVRLPDRFYLSRQLRSGVVVYDVVPWEGAVDYVTDGQGYGVLLQSGEIRWFRDDRVERFDEEFRGVDLDALVSGLEEYVRQYRVLQDLWRDDIAALHRLRSDRGSDGVQTPEWLNAPRDRDHLR